MDLNQTSYRRLQHNDKVELILSVYLLLLLLVKMDNLKSGWDGLHNEIAELFLLDGEGIEILGGPKLELGNFATDLLDLDGLSVWASGEFKELPWGSNRLWHVLKGQTNSGFSELLSKRHIVLNI